MISKYLLIIFLLIVMSVEAYRFYLSRTVTPLLKLLARLISIPVFFLMVVFLLGDIHPNFPAFSLFPLLAFMAFIAGVYLSYLLITLENKPVLGFITFFSVSVAMLAALNDTFSWEWNFPDIIGTIGGLIATVTYLDDKFDIFPWW